MEGEQKQPLLQFQAHQSSGDVWARHVDQRQSFDL
jgi:hypothetical protein